MKNCRVQRFQNKIYLVWRQLIDFEMRRLPGIDRCFMAEGLGDVLKNNKVCKRLYEFKNSNGFFPITTADDSLDGLGWDFAVHRFSGRSIGPVDRTGCGRPKNSFRQDCFSILYLFIISKEIGR